MSALRLDDGPAKKPDDDLLVAYWRRKYTDLQADTVAATITSLRTQLRSIKQIAEDGELDALERIRFHARVGLEINR